MTEAHSDWESGVPYFLKDEGAALIYCTDAPEPFPIHGRFLDIQGSTPTSWTKDGFWSGSPAGNPNRHPLDLTILRKI